MFEAVEAEASFEWLSKLWSLFGVPNIVRHLIFRVPQKGTINPKPKKGP